MPKTGIFDDTITFSSFLELREKITALQYLTGEKDFSNVARNLLTKAVEAEIDAIPEDKKKYFSQILENVKAVSVVRRQKRQEKRVTAPPPPGNSSDS